MPRKPRLSSSSGMYHVLLRCVKNDRFFRDASDYSKFFELLKNNKSECEYKLYAYMLSENEIRLLIKVGTVQLENIFKRLCVKYTYWYNCKYQRSGSLFFDRFKSEPVEDDEKFGDAYRYIIQYPQLCGICMDFKEYKYSSMNGELAVDVHIKYDDEFLNETVEAGQLNSKKQIKRITDEKAEEIILEVMKKSSLQEIISLSSADRYSRVNVLIKKGIGYRQLSRLLNMNY